MLRVHELQPGVLYEVVDTDYSRGEDESYRLDLKRIYCTNQYVLGVSPFHNGHHVVYGFGFKAFSGASWHLWYAEDKSFLFKELGT